MKKGALIIGLSFLALTSCKKQGCMDENASNYDPEAKKAGACEYIPSITLNGNNPDTVLLGETYVDPGATASTIDGEPISVMADTSNMHSDTVGTTFKIYYTASNEIGTVTADRDVYVAMNDNAWFNHTWVANSSCDQFQFPVAADPTWSAGANPGEVIIDNFFTLVGGTVNGTVDGQDITIPVQTINIQLGDIHLQGSGSINDLGTMITINYDYDNTAPLVGGLGSCSVTYTP